MKDQRITKVLQFSMGPRTRKKEMVLAVKATEEIIENLSVHERASLTSVILKNMVTDYLKLSPEDRYRLNRNKLAISTKPYQQEMKDRPLSDMMQLYLDRERPQIKERRYQRICASIKAWEDFFEENDLIFYSQLNFAVVESFPTWRSSHRNSPNWKTTKPLAAATINHDLQVMKNVIRRAVRMEWIEERYLFEDVKVKKTLENTRQVLPLSADQVRKLMYLLSGEENVSIHDMTLFLLCTGMRAGEAESLTRTSFNLKQKVIKVHDILVSGVGGGKTDSASRMIPLCSTVTKLLSRGNMLERHSQGWAARVGSWLRKHKTRIEAEVGMHVTVHQLRHTYASIYLMAGLPMARVSRMLGHKSLQITMDFYASYELDGESFEAMEADHKLV